jgi:peptidoglycan/LPS O-acetylase OafA/YrhL
VAIYLSCLFLGIPKSLLLFSINSFGVDTISALRFSNEFLWNGLVGLLICCHIFAIGRLTQSESAPLPASKMIKWFAGASFSLYLVHYPALQMLHALLPGDLTPVFRHGLLLVGTVAISLIFAQLFERSLASFRKAILSISHVLTGRAMVSRNC